MQIKYHADIDVLAIYFRDKSLTPPVEPSQARTIEINESVNIDLDSDGQVQSMEILGASQFIDDVGNLHIKGLIPHTLQQKA
jgi:uncharacterized protein YuzE